MLALVNFSDVQVFVVFAQLPDVFHPGNSTENKVYRFRIERCRGCQGIYENLPLAIFKRLPKEFYILTQNISKTSVLARLC